MKRLILTLLCVFIMGVPASLAHWATPANQSNTDTSNFGANLNSTHNTVQKALDALDEVAGVGDTTNTNQDDAWGSPVLTGTQTLITVAYNSTANTTSFVVSNDLNLYDWTNVTGTDLKTGSVTQAYDVFLQDVADLTDPAADRLLGFDNTDNDVRFIVIGTGLSYDAGTDTLSATGTTTFAGMTDTDITGPATHDIVAWNSTDWVDLSIGGDLAGAVNGSAFDLTLGTDVVDVDALKDDAAPSDEDIVTYEATGTTFQYHTIAEMLENISATQGTVLYRGVAGWSALAVGISGQYLQTQGAAADPQWASPGISGDVEGVGDCVSGACFDADGTGTTLYFEGTTANLFEAILTSVDVTADVTVTIPQVTGTLVLGPAAFGIDNRMIKTNGTGNLTQITAITVDDSNNVSGVGTFGSGAITSSATVEGATLTEGGNAVYNSTETPGGELGGTWASPTIDDSLTVATWTFTGTTTVADIDGSGTISANLFTPDAADGANIGSTTLEFSDVYLADASIIYFGNDQDVSLTHVADTGLDINLALGILDDQSLILGTNDDWTASYDETTDDRLEFVNIAGTSGDSDVYWDLNDDGADATYTITNSDATYEANLVIEGDISYGGSLLWTGTGDSKMALSNNAGGYTAASGYEMYVDAGVWKIYDGTEAAIVIETTSPTWSGTTHDFSSVTNLVLPTAAADASGEISMSTGNQLIWHDGTKVVTIDTTPTNDNYVLKYDNASATFTLEADETGGTPAWNTITDSTGAMAVISGASGETTTFTQSADNTEWLFDFTAAFTTAASPDLVKFIQQTGNAEAVDLVTIQAADTDVTPLRISHNGEDLTFAYSGANEMTIGSGTGVDTLVLSSMGLEATTITTSGLNTPSGGVASSTPVTGDADTFAAAFTGANLYGGHFIANGTGTAQLPAMLVGMNFCITTLGAIAVIADTNVADGYLMDGTTGIEGANLTNLSTAGDIACFRYYTADDWLITTNGWTPE